MKKLLAKEQEHQAMTNLLWPENESALLWLYSSEGWSTGAVQCQGGNCLLASLSDLPVNMHEKLICKNSVKSKCFDEEDWNNKKGGVRKWDKYNIILDCSAVS